MGNRDGSVCVYVWVCVGGTVGEGTSELVRLFLSHTDNGMLSHTPDGL